MISQKTLPFLLLLLATCCTVFAEKTNDGEDAVAEEHNKEGLEEKRKEDSLIQAQFGYSFDDISDKLVVIKHEMGSGSGFIATMDGKTYLFTNQHIILGAEKISFTTLSGKKLRPRKVELSVTRDIARLLLADDTESFGITGEMPMDSPVGVFGNSDTDEVATKLYGTVTGVGAEIVEVSADFVSGNSGSPVLNIDQEVLGIASYVRKSDTHAMKEGTKFENRTRRFCYRLTGNQWKPVNWKQYNDKYGRFYYQNTLFTDGVIEVLTNWGDTPRDRISISENPEKSLVSWTKSHNELIEKYSHKTRIFASEYSGSLKKLSESCSSRARQTRLFSEQRELTEYLREELDSQSVTLDYIAKLLVRISKRAKDYR
ncbi:MAG: hypothetical protein DRQ97_14090 [Gammaproteobacteria bacterium]|nr:MAG: hypothetical protein DRQ97_14090 [Gammaproteobacteria bacterium]